MSDDKRKRKPDETTEKQSPEERQSPEEIEERRNRDKQSQHKQDLLDEGIDESFPASDPPSISRID